MPLLLLDPYVDALLVIALALLAPKIVKALLGPIAAIPGAGFVIDGIVSKATQAVAHICGVILGPIDKAVGASLHAMGRIVDACAGAFRSTAHTLNAAVGLLVHVVGAMHVLRQLVATVHGATSAVTHAVKALEHGFHVLAGRLTAIEKLLAHGLLHGVIERLKILANSLAHIEHIVIPDIRAIAVGAVADVQALRQWIALHFPAVGTEAFAGAVAVALGALGLGGLRCNNFKNLLGKYACGLGTILDDLIGLALSVLALESVCAFLPLLEDAFGAIVGPMVHLLNNVPLGACEHPPDGWAQLSVAAGPQPPPQTLGTFPQE